MLIGAGRLEWLPMREYPQINDSGEGRMPPSTPTAGSGSHALEPGGVATCNLTTAQAAAKLGVSNRTLEDWRCRGGGPLFVRLGRRLIRYRPCDLNTFVDANVMENTGSYR